MTNPPPILQWTNHWPLGVRSVFFSLPSPIFIHHQVILSYNLSLEWLPPLLGQVSGGTAMVKS
jgi:hypothetical protein